MNNHQFHSSILRAYDIRGIYNETLFDKDAFFVGKAFGSFLKKNGKNSISIACDGRLSSPALKAELINGLLTTGVKVFDVGLGPTPMLYFSVFHLNLDAGIMITGSHNPKNHNGFKMMLKERPFFGKDIQNLAKIIEKKDFAKGVGDIDSANIKDDYIERLLLDCKIESEGILADDIDQYEAKNELRIAWDAGNGAAGEIMKKLTKRLHAKSFIIFDEIDGTFPNHHPDPTVEENLQDLKNLVAKNKCDLGIAFDGDGDRIGVIDDEGVVIWGDQLMCFYAKEILDKNPGSTIIADVKASNVLFEEVEKNGGKAIMWKTGHSLIKSKMKEEKALLAGEMSGHIFFADKYYGFDDALYAAIRLINILANSKKKLSDLRKELPKTFSTTEVRIDCEEQKKFSSIENLKHNLNGLKVNFDDTDGLRVLSENGWWLLRASNTQAAIVARCEGKSLKDLEKLKGQLREYLDYLGLEIPKDLK
jgi:phosphomannomutase